jgi:outer membrane autotransporter protein
LAATNVNSMQSLLDSLTSHIDSGGAGGDQTASAAGLSGVSPAQASSMDGVRIWGGSLGSGSHTDATASSSAYSTRQSGLMVGIESDVAPGLLLGGAFGYTTGNLHTNNDLGQFSDEQFAVYARYTGASGIYLQGNVAYGVFQNRLDRAIVIPGLATSSTHGKFDSHSIGVYTEAGYHLGQTQLFSQLTPYAALSYLDATSDAYTETGNFLLPLAVAGSSSATTSSYLGLKLSNTWLADALSVTPRLKLAWQHDFNEVDWQSTATFAVLPTTGFQVRGTGLSRDGAYLNAGVTVSSTDNVDLMLDYDGRFTGDRSESTFMGRAAFRF